MDETIRLKSMQFQFSEDRQLVKVCFWDEEENGTAILLESKEMRGLTAEFIRVTTSLQVDQALAPDPDASPTPSQSLPATETALLPIRQIGVARWRAGGAILKVTTHTGVAMQLALSPALREGLRDSLSAELPEE
ncbi:MAG TPA: hypothetical protein VN280_22555 [Variovorax sp.]|nr:hypothetical protein [Variovorax sp.]